jgi:hypothetical protein
MWYDVVTNIAFLQKDLKSVEQNFIPLSVLRTFSFLSVCFSTMTFQALKDSNASDLFLRK